MKNIFLQIAILFCLVTGLTYSSFAQFLPDNTPLRVVIIRHGEKPDSGYNLSCKGYNRSLQIPEIITSQFGVPDFTYVPKISIGKATKSVRMYQTVVPLAVKYNLLINSKYDENDSFQIATDILEKKGTVLVVWNSTDIPSIVRRLGIVNNELLWDEADYDSIWVINFVRVKEGKLRPVFSRANENIKPSRDCK